MNLIMETLQMEFDDSGRKRKKDLKRNKIMEIMSSKIELYRSMSNRSSFCCIVASALHPGEISSGATLNTVGCLRRPKYVRMNIKFNYLLMS